jgi:hypothetical protein
MLGPKLSRQGYAVYPRQYKVKDDQIGVASFQNLPHCPAIACGVDPESFTL